MPRGDGTRPPGGSGRGTGRGVGQGGQGKGRMGGTRPEAGPSGNCVRPNCGAKFSHQIGVPCYNVTCPQCGAKMVRG